MTDFDSFLMDRLEVEPDTLERALVTGQDRRITVARALMEMGALSAEEFGAHASDFLSAPVVAMTDLPSEPVLIEVLPPKFLTRSKCIPLQDDGTTLVLAMVDPFDDAVAKSAGMATGRSLSRRVIDETLWEDAMARIYDLGDAAMERLSAAFGPREAAEARKSDDMSSDAPVIQMVKLVVQRAVRLRASDIHIEPFEDRLQLRYRIDGILVDQPPPPAAMVDALTSRLKIMADLNIAERRRAQDGRFAYRLDGRDVDLRLSTLPTVHGESIVLRILDKTEAVFDFETLGLAERETATLAKALAQPNGMILTTGPTGSGKTTTLYSALMRLNAPERKIITIEDPVEYQLDGVNQIAVNPRIDMGFASVLRNVLRQDPDVIMVGEMRDSETAEIAVRAAMTGHLVLSSAHTNTAIGAIVRLRDMGVPAFLISATLTAVLAQRLLRRVCPECVGHRPTEPEDAAFFDTPPEKLAVATGCEACAGTGYSGRFGVYEILPMTSEFREHVAKGASEQALVEAARANGHQSLMQAGLAQVAKGTTTIEEVLRVVGVSHG